MIQIIFTRMKFLEMNFYFGKITYIKISYMVRDGEFENVPSEFIVSTITWQLEKISSLSKKYEIEQSPRFS